MTCVALDMDETLGHFSQASLLWSAARDGILACNRDQLVRCLLEIPGLFNPDMPNIIKVLKKGKDDETVGTVVIYTNNTAPREWPEIVAESINRMSGCHIIDDVIDDVINDASAAADDDDDSLKMTTMMTTTTMMMIMLWIWIWC